jgi:hypothetical protein
MTSSLQTILVAAIAGSQLLAIPLATACPPEESGVVSGTNTVDYQYFSGDFSPGTYALGVKATGTGNNTFTIKVEKRGSLGWSTVTSASVDLGDVANNCGYRELQFTLTSSEEIRYRFSRTVGSTQVNYSWDTDFLVVWGGSSFRCLNC